MTAQVESWREDIEATVSALDPETGETSQDTSLVVHWGCTLSENGTVLKEWPAADNHGMTKDQVEARARDYADEIGVGTVSPEEMLAHLEADEVAEMAAHARELERLQQTKLAVQRRTDGLTRRDAAALRGRNRSRGG